ncbi:MAG: alpha/beta fold hydrolase [Candidatus Sericytochromatia bacterium]
MTRTLFFADTPPQLDFPPLNSGIFHLPAPFLLDSGQVLTQPRLAWRRLGQPHLPAVVILGGISAGRYAWRADKADEGWWQTQIGLTRPLNPEQYQLISVDFLGSTGSSSGPHNSPQAGPDFPSISTRDQARALAALVESLGLNQLQSIIGASYGGMVTLAFAQHFPHLLKRALVICAAESPSPLATGWRHIQREIIQFALDQGEPEKGLKLARALAVTSYRSEQEFTDRFAAGLGPDSCLPYLEHQGECFSQRFDPHSYLCLSTSIDTHQVEPKSIAIPVDLLGFSSDQLVPVAQLQQLQKKLKRPGFLQLLESIYGHDAFLKEGTDVSQILKQHLEQ